MKSIMWVIGWDKEAYVTAWKIDRGEKGAAEAEIEKRSAYYA